MGKGEDAMKRGRSSVEQLVRGSEASRGGHFPGRPHLQGWDQGTDL